MASVKVKNIGSFRIENETNGPEIFLLLFPHFARDVVAVAKLVRESLAFAVEKEATLTSQR